MNPEQNRGQDPAAKSDPANQLDKIQSIAPANPVGDLRAMQAASQKGDHYSVLGLVDGAPFQQVMENYSYLVRQVRRHGGDTKREMEDLLVASLGAIAPALVTKAAESKNPLSVLGLPDGASLGAIKSNADAITRAINSYGTLPEEQLDQALRHVRHARRELDPVALGTPKAETVVPQTAPGGPSPAPQQSNPQPQGSTGNPPVGIPAASSAPPTNPVAVGTGANPAPAASTAGGAPASPQAPAVATPVVPPGGPQVGANVAQVVAPTIAAATSQGHANPPNPPPVTAATNAGGEKAGDGGIRLTKIAAFLGAPMVGFGAAFVSHKIILAAAPILPGAFGALPLMVGVSVAACIGVWATGVSFSKAIGYMATLIDNQIAAPIRNAIESVKDPKEFYDITKEARNKFARIMGKKEMCAELDKVTEVRLDLDAGLQEWYKLSASQERSDDDIQKLNLSKKEEDKEKTKRDGDRNVYAPIVNAVINNTQVDTPMLMKDGEGNPLKLGLGAQIGIRAGWLCKKYPEMMTFGNGVGGIQAMKTPRHVRTWYRLGKNKAGGTAKDYVDRMCASDPDFNANWAKLLGTDDAWRAKYAEWNNRGPAIEAILKTHLGSDTKEYPRFDGPLATFKNWFHEAAHKMLKGRMHSSSFWPLRRNLMDLDLGRQLEAMCKATDFVFGEYDRFGLQDATGQNTVRNTIIGELSGLRFHAKWLEMGEKKILIPSIQQQVLQKYHPFSCVARDFFENTILSNFPIEKTTSIVGVAGAPYIGALTGVNPILIAAGAMTFMWGTSLLGRVKNLFG